jgi:2-amino-4-hydroxy-6-hydroxymethyldihydropteridine diphosphokinase
MTLAYIAIGSNLASPLEQVNAAVNALAEIPDSRVISVSSFYRTPPLGPQDQPDYLNAAVALETTLDADALLNHTQRIELQQGRTRKAERWGPRTLDLDIMLFGNEVINTPRLTVPHYDMQNRGFMLWPLFEIAPELRFPDGPAARRAGQSRRGKTRRLVIPLHFLAITAIVVIGCLKPLPPECGC